MQKTLSIRIFIVSTLAIGALFILFLGCKSKSNGLLAKQDTVLTK
ncbi:MAG: hypothetical protein ACLGGV_06195 [Bacteroidia bacterium]